MYIGDIACKKYYRRPIDLTAVRRMIFAFYGLLAAAMLIYVGLFS